MAVTREDIHLLLAGEKSLDSRAVSKERIEYPIHKEALMYHYTHEDLELLYLMSDGIDGEDADPGATQELRDLEAEGQVLPWAVL